MWKHYFEHDRDQTVHDERMNPTDFQGQMTEVKVMNK